MKRHIAFDEIKHVEGKTESEINAMLEYDDSALEAIPKPP
jgi:hypothetical protein